MANDIEARINRLLDKLESASTQTEVMEIEEKVMALKRISGS